MNRPNELNAILARLDASIADMAAVAKGTNNVNAIEAAAVIKDMLEKARAKLKSPEFNQWPHTRN